MPSPLTEFTLTIRRVTGETLQFKLQRTPGQIREAGAVLEKSLAANYLGFVQEGKLVIIPSHQIAGIEIDPAPKVFMQHVIKDAEPVAEIGLKSNFAAGGQSRRLAQLKRRKTMKARRLLLTLVAILAVTVRADDTPKVKAGVMAKATATVEAINLKSREVTLKSESGETRIFVAGPEIKRLNEVKVGDTVTVGYRVSVALEFREPTAAEKETPLVESEVTAHAPRTAAPAGTSSRQIRALMTITAIDRAAGTVTLKGPKDRTITEAVEDPARLEKLQVGQALIVTFTEDIALSLEPAAK